ncbi:amidohydrolase family protein [Paraburkholderia diazotrophica]|uniref:Predicted metal-dependent hydrolase, TIM-barrel fold n=1 Tax=Paraburkholderia diazotrophica TaxID=667676 RepID=A0A1H7EG65_9BURK|nr:amidohydrolase family protein [Paraburkholderia diazotrophica]SEK11032.1 Predicted metal-dependent hydrolase, TIM-barrel fold [Paraburkholderia diazotrophica]
MMEKSGTDASHRQDARRPARIGSVDTHAHVFERGLPLTQRRRYAPDYDAPLDAYLAQLDAHGITHGVLVQPSFLGADCSYLLDALRRAPERLRGVAVIGRDCAKDTLTEMADAGVAGIRLNLIGHADLPLDNWVSGQTLAYVRELGWHVEVHAEAARLQRIVEPLLEAGVNVVVDHFGRPDPDLGVRDPGFRRLLELAHTQRVWVKISAAYRNWRDLRTGDDDMHEAVRLLKEAFGPGRLMWGSDWPHTQYEAREHFAHALKLFRALLADDEERSAVLADTPARLYMFNGLRPCSCGT